MTFVLKLVRHRLWKYRKTSIGVEETVANTKAVLDMSNEQQGGQHACILVGDRCMVRNEIACKPNSQITQHLIGHTRGSFFFFKLKRKPLMCGEKM